MSALAALFAGMVAFPLILVVVWLSDFVMSS